MLFGLLDFGLATYGREDARARNMVAVGLGAALIAGMLSDVLSTGQWGVGGGLGGGAFDMFLDGVEATMTRAYSIGESMMITAEVLAVFAVSQCEAVEKCRELIVQINIHAAKLVTTGPGGPYFDHWAKEIRAWLDKISRKTEDMKGKTQQAWKKYVDDFRAWLDNRLGPPPVAPG